MKRATVLFFMFCIAMVASSKAQTSTKSKAGCGVRFSMVYNYRVIHAVPDFSMMFGRHNVYFGPEFTYVSNTIKGDPVDPFKKKAFGANIGYRYYSNELKKRLKIFAQFDFAIYQISFVEYQQGLTYGTERNQFILENTATVGAEYKLFKGIYVNAGLGIGSYDGFFLMLDSFTPSSYIGIEYRFIKIQ